MLDETSSLVPKNRYSLRPEQGGGDGGSDDSTLVDMEPMYESFSSLSVVNRGRGGTTADTDGDGRSREFPFTGCKF